jgi:hypothetical protein
VLANYAGRRIVLRDGMIVSDEVKTPPPMPAPAAAPQAV